MWFGGWCEEMDLCMFKKMLCDGEFLICNGWELVEDLVIGSLVNWGNEVWDLNDFFISVVLFGNLLIKML